MTAERTIEFLTLDSFDTKAIPASFVYPETLAKLTPLISCGGGTIFQFRLKVTHDIGASMFSIFAADRRISPFPLSQGTVCFESSYSQVAFTHALRSWTACMPGRSAPNVAPPKSVPWQVVSLVPFGLAAAIKAGFSPNDVAVLGCLHSCLAWAIVKYREGVES